MLSNETLSLSHISGNFVLFFGGHILLCCKDRTATPSLVLRAPLVPGIGHMQGKMPQFCSIFGFGAKALVHKAFCWLSSGSLLEALWGIFLVLGLAVCKASTLNP